MMSRPPTTGRGTATGAPWLVALLLLTFAIGTDDFVLAGVLPEIAREFDVSEPVAGQLVTVFALVYGLSAPLCASLTSGRSRRMLLISLTGAFTLANVLGALAPTYETLMILRVVAAVLAGAATPAAFSAAAELAPTGRGGRHLGVVQAGLTLALVAGVPLGTWIAALDDWRTTLLVVAAISAVAGLGLAVSLPQSRSVAVAGMGERVRVLATPAIGVGLVGTATGGAGAMMVYSYIAPVTRDLSGAEDTALSLIIAGAGLGALAGSFLGGRYTDLWGARRTILVALVGQMIVTFVMAGFGLFLTGGRVPAVLMGVLMGFWGVSGFSLNPPIQSRIIELTGDAGAEAVALNASALYLGVAAGAGVGGVALAAGGPIGVLVAAGGLLAVSVAIFCWSFRYLDPATLTANGGAVLNTRTGAATADPYPNDGGARG